MNMIIDQRYENALLTIEELLGVSKPMGLLQSLGQSINNSNPDEMKAYREEAIRRLRIAMGLPPIASIL